MSYLSYLMEQMSVNTRTTCFKERRAQSQQTQNFCITFVQRRPNVFDVGPTLYKCYTNILCLLGYFLNEIANFQMSIWMAICELTSHCNSNTNIITTLVKTFAN